MSNIFISYSSKDAAIAKKMNDHLTPAGFRVLIDHHPRPGRDWRFDIDDAIRDADAIVVIVTPAAAESVYVTYEWVLALGLGKRVIPVIFKRANIHPRLTSLGVFHYGAWREPDHFWGYFVREMRRIVVDVTHDSLMQSENRIVAQPIYDQSVMPTQPGYWLVVRRGPNFNQMIQLQGDKITLGREDDNMVRIDDSEVSRHHLRFSWQDGGYMVEDLNSTNGTSIDGQPLTYIRMLRRGDVLLLGDSVILSYEVVD